MSRIVKLSSLEKALGVLDYLGLQGNARLAEVSRDLNLPRATAFRALATLERQGYVTHRRDQRSFSLGPRIAELARGLETMTLADLAAPAMADLRERTAETVNLAVLRRGLLEYVAILEGTHPLRMSGRVGEAVPVHATALGKAILAVLPQDRRDRLVGPEPYESLTRHTIIRRADLEADLARTEERGYALDNEEIDIGAVCVAAAIEGADGSPAGALSVSAVSARHSMDDLVGVGKMVQAWALQLSRMLRDGSRGLEDDA